MANTAPGSVILRRVGLCAVKHNGESTVKDYRRSKSVLKGVCHEIFDLQFFFMIRTHLGP